ncbi:MAG: hypothetical protein KKE91_00875, partial [Candidatus Omnitrophica bacterium]|nr:hypothetical protein [Candidatus Omnitrophota bacterium]
DKDYITMLIYNYIDPEIARNYISRNIASLNDRERRALLGLIKSDRLTEIMARQLDISTLRTSHKVKTLLKKVQELNDRAQNSGSTNRNIKINIKNLKGDYSYQRYAIDSSCNLNCQFMPIEEKEVSASGPYQEILKLEPYSVNMIILKKKPKEPESPPATVSPSTEPNQNITGHPD